MFFSIIIATKNSSKFIYECLNSISNQTYKNFEVIIKDADSVDNTYDIINQFIKNNKLNNFFLHSSKDNSIYEAWNFCIKKANGEYILFIGSDDFLKKDALMNYFNFINNNTKFDYITSRINKVNNGTYVSTIGRQIDNYKINKYMGIVHIGSLHCSSIFKKYGTFDQLFKIAGDYEFILRIKNNINIGFMDTVIADSEIGGISDNGYKAQIEGMNAKLMHVKKIKILIYLETAFILIKIYLKKFI